MANDNEKLLLLSTFNFEIRLTPSVGYESDKRKPGKFIANGGFQEASGLEVDMDIQEYYEGGRNDAVVRRIGRARYNNIILKRGMLYSTKNNSQVVKQLWEWFQNIVSGGPPLRYNGIIEVKDRKGTTVLAKWAFDRGLPARVRGPELNAKTGEIAIEELHIAHEGLRLL